VTARVAGRLADPAILQESSGERLRGALTELGTTWIKFGQMLSMRPDIVGADVAAELEKLQADVPPDPPGVAKQLVESELGGSVEELYGSFDPPPDLTERAPTASGRNPLHSRHFQRRGRDSNPRYRGYPHNSFRARRRLRRMPDEHWSLPPLEGGVGTAFGTVAQRAPLLRASRPALGPVAGARRVGDEVDLAAHDLGRLVQDRRGDL